MNFLRFIRTLSTRRPGTYDTKDPVAIIKSEVFAIDYKKGTAEPLEPACPRETDVVIIGGGLIGNSVAYWLTQRNPSGFTCTVIERDPTYTRASSVVSAGGIRHQFSIRQNVEMSLFTTQFLRDIKLHLSVLDLEPPHVPFQHQGYLFLATEEYAETLAKQVTMQNDVGAAIEFLTHNQLKDKFPWLNTDGVAAASYGLYGEGCFDPWSLMTALKRKNLSHGVRYVNGEVTAFNSKTLNEVGSPETMERLTQVDVKLPNGDIQPLSFAFAVNCAGAFSGDLAKLAGIGNGDGFNAIPLPVQPRKRYVYMIHSDQGPGLDAPFLIDMSGVYFRREGVGGHYICGRSPNEKEEPSIDTLDVDYDWFSNKIWPNLAHRVPGFECLKVKSAWAGYYDHNYFDHNAIIGNHPYYDNLYFATGFSGHGVQHALAAGRGIMELAFDNEYKTIDLSIFGFERVLRDQPLYEEGIV